MDTSHIFFQSTIVSLIPLKECGRRLKSTQKPIYNIVSLRKNVVLALESVLLESIQKQITKVCYYVLAYLQGLKGGSELLSNIKKLSNHITKYPRDNNGLVLYSLSVFFFDHFYW